MTAETVPPNRSTRRRARTRAALVAAARKVFADHGVDASTIQQIADTADVAKGSFYNHFESRDEILRAAAADVLEELGAALDRRLVGRDLDPAHTLAASLLCTLRTCVQDPTVGGFVLATTRLDKVAESALGRRGRRDLREGLAAGRFLFDDLETVVTVVAGGAQGLLRRRLRGDLDAAADLRFVTLVLRMLGIPVDAADAIVAEVAALSEQEELG